MEQATPADPGMAEINDSVDERAAMSRSFLMYMFHVKHCFLPRGTIY